MTCQQAKSLLEDYIDGEVAAREAAELLSHLETCPECQAELESSKHLKNILSRQISSDPGPEYWAEVMPLILARTVESEPGVVERVPAATDGEYQKLRLVRSGVLLAASLALMYTAITLGTGHRAANQVPATMQRPFFLASTLQGLTAPDNFAIVTPKEQADLARVTAAMGAPGLLGRFTVLPGLLSFE